MKLETKAQIFPFKLAGVAGFSWGNQSPHAPLVLCLHGWLDNANSFLPLAQLSSANGPMRFLAIDFAGHGQSDWRHEAHQYYFVDYVADVIALLNKLGVSSCHIIGHSMGALVASVLASCFPERVKSLSLIDGIGLMHSEASNARSLLRTSIMQRENLKLKQAKLFPSKRDVVLARKAVSDLSEEHIEMLMDRSIVETNDGAYLRSDPKLKISSPFRYTQLQAKALLLIEAPTLLVLGKQGYPEMKAALIKFQDNYHSLQTIEIDGGHHCHIESPCTTYEHISHHISANNRCEL
ncbi:putative hydrolase [Pseudoalteromonas luteoviolacea B = ATCC 29581]|nr:putative hydrolase [Pseudoalteromonas luteoviolacea B = ATCC 29581]